MPDANAKNSRRLIVLGSTGSIGVNTLAVVEHLTTSAHCRFEVAGLAAGANAKLLAEQARRFDVPHVAIADENQFAELREIKHVYRGADSALELVEQIARRGDLVVGAMVGSAGIPAILAAIERGCDIALANKETLVAAGAIVMPLVAKRGVKLLPVDSEHSAIFQCLEGVREGLEAWRPEGLRKGEDTDSQAFKPSRLQASGLQASSLHASLRRIVLTASGGPFRTWSKQRMYSATVEQALNHPTWNMGPKVTIDSASLMNKALEIIEAHWLFDLPPEKIEVIIHPQSLIHSFVEFVDNSVLAQLGPPDMRTPIQYALTWPQRCEGISRALDWNALKQMEFEQVDAEKFIAPQLAYEAIRRGGTAGATLNAANEAAVAAFLERRIQFGQISELVAEAMNHAIDVGNPVEGVHTMDDLVQADRAAHEFVRGRIDSNKGLGAAIGR